MKSADVVEEVEFLLSCGVSAFRIAAQLGMKPGSVERALHRAGRPDLAPRFTALRHAEERVPCPECGDLIGRKAKRCYPCAIVAQKSDPAYIERHLAGIRRSLTSKGLTRQAIPDRIAS